MRQTIAPTIAIKLITGKPIKYHPASRESRETGTREYRQDKVMIDGKELEGHVQVKTVRDVKMPNGKYTTKTRVITTYKGAAVIGHDINWLAEQNGILLLAAPPEPMSA